MPQSYERGADNRLILEVERPTSPMSPEMTTPTQHEIARDLSAMLDAKAERLERLIAHAEEVIARLETAAQPPTGAPAPPAIAANETRASSRRPAQSDPQLVPVKPQAMAATAASESEPTDSLRRAIYALADGGRSPAEISRELDEHIGKVELILALRFG